jgi:hypothetical protein
MLLPRNVKLEKISKGCEVAPGCVKEQHSDGKNHVAKFMSYVIVS